MKHKALTSSLKRTKKIKNKKLFAILAIGYSLLAISFHAEAQIISTIAGNGIYGYSGDGGQATAAELNYSFGLFTSNAGNVYIADNANHRGREIQVNGIITTFIGNGIGGYSGDGGQAAAAEIANPADVVMDASGNIYVVDFGDNCVREINTSGIVSTFAGNGIAGYTGDGIAATAAELNNACGLAVDDSGNIYISDRSNYRIRMVNTSGIIFTYAGNGVSGYSGDGGAAAAAEITEPNGITMDGNGNLYIADYEANCVRKVTTSDTISTMAGNGTAGYNGDGIPATAAELFNPMGVAVDAFGNVYIADHSNSRIREVLLNDSIYTYAGNGIGGYSGDGGAATAAQISVPSGVCTDATGNLYISDEGNARVRMVTPSVTTATNQLVGAIHESPVQVYPNPSTGIVNCKWSMVNENTQLEVYNMLGEKVYTSTLPPQPPSPPSGVNGTGGASVSYAINLSAEPNGIYLYRVINEDGSLAGEGKLIIQK